MTRTECDRLTAHETVLTVLTTNAPLYQSLPPMVQSKAEFAELVGAIGAGSHKQPRAAQPGVADRKAQARLELVSHAQLIAAITHAAAATAGLPELARRVDYSFSALIKGRDSAVVARCQDIHAAVTAHLPLLADSQVNQATLDSLAAKITAFEQLKPAPRNRWVARSTATKSLKGLFRQANALLTSRLDKQMVRFKQSQPEFYHAYTAARKIVKQRGPSAADHTNVVSVTPTNAATSNATRTKAA